MSHNLKIYRRSECNSQYEKKATVSIHSVFTQREWIYLTHNTNFITTTLIPMVNSYNYMTRFIQVQAHIHLFSQYETPNIHGTQTRDNEQQNESMLYFDIFIPVLFVFV